MSNPSPIPFIDLAADLSSQREECDEAIRRVLDSGSFLLGKELLAFEDEFAAYNGSMHAVGVASGLAALKLMLQSCDVGPGDEVIVPANTYIATWLAISAVGAVPVPVEPDLETRNIDPSRLTAEQTARTKAVLAVHMYGSPCDMEVLRTFCDENGFLLLVDAAQACGAEWLGERRACLGDAAAFSFYPTKNLGAFGDAGAVVTDCPERAEKVRLLRNYGMQDRCNHHLKGENARMEELHAAVLRVKLRSLAAKNARRKALADIYRGLLADEKNIVMQKILSAATPAWHLFTVTLTERHRVIAALAAEGIETAIHYPVPPHLSVAYQADQVWPSLPITETMARHIMSLPLYPSLTDLSVQRIAETLTFISKKGER